MFTGDRNGVIGNVAAGISARKGRRERSKQANEWTMGRRGEERNGRGGPGEYKNNVLGIGGETKCRVKDADFV